MSLETDILRDEERDSAPPCTEPDYSSYDLIELFQLAKQGDEGAAAELSRRSAPRTSDFNYELRHPGHGDQSTHNPHKGAAAYAPGAWKPVSPAQLAAMDKAVIEDLYKQNRIARLGGDNPIAVELRDRIASRYMRERAQGETYVNGNIVVRLPKGSKLDEAQKQALFDDIDNAAKFTPAGMMGDMSFPIEISVGRVSGRSRVGEWGGSGVGGRMGISTAHVKQGGLTKTGELYTLNKPGGIFPEQVPWHPSVAIGKSEVSHTIFHEFGHAVQDYKEKDGIPASRYRFDYVGVPFISKYATKNGSERYAEHFSAWVLGATDTLTQEIADHQGWRKP